MVKMTVTKTVTLTVTIAVTMTAKLTFPITVSMQNEISYSDEYRIEKISFDTAKNKPWNRFKKEPSKVHSWRYLLVLAA